MLEEEYTPTTEEVRNCMALGVAMAAYVVPEETHSGNVDWPIPGYRENAKTAFDRWLKAHDREVAAQALEPIRAAEAEWRRTSMNPRTWERDWVKADIHFRTQVLAALRSGTEGSTD